MGMWAVKLFDY